MITEMDTSNSETTQMLLFPPKITSKRKCHYYDKGYCKNKDQCKFYHATTDCKNQCIKKSICPNRHKKECKYGDKCYHNQDKSCEFLHLESNLSDVTLLTNDNQQ